MKRILNTWARSIGLNNGNVKVDLPIGGFCTMEDSEFDTLMQNKQVQRMHAAKAFAVTDGQPLNREVPLAKRSAERKIPERFKPKEDQATLGTSKPTEVKVDTVEVSVDKKTVKGKQVSAQKVDPKKGK